MKMTDEAADDGRPQPPSPERAAPLPSAADRLDVIAPGGRPPAVFLDYDGTLTPIVDRPEDAWLDPSMRNTLERLSQRCRLAILSGRDLPDVRRRVGLDHIWYAGSHGFDIAGPAGERMEYREGVRYLPALDAAEQALIDSLGAMAGCQVERKRFAIAVHYRRVAEGDVAEVKRRVDAVHSSHAGLRLAPGKKVIELRPDIEWHKGTALRWLMKTLGLDPGRVTVLYIGDDATDEDAFAELANTGAGILVADADRPTRARYRLEDPAAVQDFLDRLTDALEPRAE